MQGHEGWDDYAPFYDWENAQTVGRRDIPFWPRLASAVRGPVLELGAAPAASRFRSRGRGYRGRHRSVGVHARARAQRVSGRGWARAFS